MAHALTTRPLAGEPDLQDSMSHNARKQKEGVNVFCFATLCIMMRGASSRNKLEVVPGIPAAVVIKACHLAIVPAYCTARLRLSPTTTLSPPPLAGIVPPLV